MRVFGQKLDHGAFTAGNAVRHRQNIDLIMLGDTLPRPEYQGWKTVAAPALYKHLLFFRNQALRDFVMAQKLTRRAIKQLKALALARAINQVHDTRRQHDRAKSEEHTSELQSLMRSTSAVLRLKKNNEHYIQKRRNMT